jgi:23S rRNA U2552 (ribose-2'-O)-methylase RlmE/FtsJ
MRAGDIVKITGALEDTQRDVKKVENNDLWNISCIQVSKAAGSIIEKISEWSVKDGGVFYYDEKKYLSPQHPEMQSLNGNTNFPTLVLQAKSKSVEKTIDLLRLRYPSVEFRESTTLMSKSKDRLIVASEVVSGSETGLHLNELCTDGILSQSVTRIYAINYLTRPHIVNPHLETAVSLFTSTFLNETNQGRDGVRIRAYPRSFASSIMSLFDTSSINANPVLSAEGVNWSPSEYSKILSALYVDGLWMLSLLDRADQSVADIYESTNQFGLGKGKEVVVNNDNSVTVKPAAPQSDRVCKSINKLHEIITRNDWAYDTILGENGTTTRSLHAYGLCVDVGASPGGWTTYLSRNMSAERVISVDRGDVKIDPLPAHVEHWRLLGHQAVEQLYNMRQQQIHDNDSVSVPLLIDLYCCDANIDPVTSTKLMIDTLVKYDLFSKDARFVLTLKNTLFKKQQWEEARAECLSLLEPHFDHIQCVSLLANTPKECTVTGIRKK